MSLTAARPALPPTDEVATMSRESAAGRKPRAFLSYGWQDNAALVRRVKEDLERKGWEAWQDKDRIEGGDAFAAEIEDGLRWCDVVVAFMGPHSTRRAGDADSTDRRDSICQRELSMADAVKGHGRTVPVMAVACSPPLLLQGLDYVDMTGCPADQGRYVTAFVKLLDALEDALDGKVRYRAWYHNLRPLDFRSTLAEKSLGFHGRGWLFREIDRWRESGATQSLMILGDPGVGKSAIAATLVLNEPRVVGHFFCRHDESTTLSPGRMAQTLAAHLAAAFPAYRAKFDDPAVMEPLDTAERDPINALVAGVFGPLGKLEAPDGGVRYLVLDALDEALESADALNAVRVLASSVERMPRWLRLIATARNESGVTDRLRALRYHPLDAGSPGNVEDVRDYVASRLASMPGATDRHVRTLCERSAGNFLYVVQTLGDVEAGHLRLDELERLPPGLTGRYLVFFERRFADEARFAPMRRLLDAMVAAAEPLHESLLAAVAGIDAEEDLPGLGRDFRQYLKHQDDWGRDPIYAFYHKSISDWLTAPERRGDTFTASARKGDRAITEWLWREYSRGPEKWPAYLVRHLPMHLRQGGRWDDLAKVLSDPQYLEARAEADEVAELAADLAAANAAEGLAGHESRRLLGRLEEAIRRDQAFIAGHPTALFQCLWNSCWWFDCPESAEHYDPPEGGWGEEGPPWSRPALSPWMRSWREAKERAGRFAWVRSMRPPAAPLRGALRVTGTGHSSAGAVALLTADGREVARVLFDESVRLWERGAGRESARLAGHQDWVSVLALSPDGRTLASASADRTVRLWDRESGRQLARLAGHEGTVWALAFSPDGRTLASGSDDRTVRLWDRESGRQLARLALHEGPVGGLAFSLDGRFLRSEVITGLVVLWDAATRQRLSLGATQGPAPDAFGSARPQARFSAVSRHGEIAILPAGSETPIAWFPRDATPESADDVTWYFSAGSEVYLLRLEGVPAAPAPREG
jgi:hypothetical protein